MGPPREKRKPERLRPKEKSSMCRSVTSYVPRLRERETISRRWSMDSTSHPAISTHRCTSETCRYTRCPKNFTRNSSTRTMALSRPRHDHRYSEEKRTCARQFSRPIDTRKLMLSEHRSHRHWP